MPESLFDLSICFYTDDQTELERRLARDVAVRERRPDWIKQTHLTRREQYRRFIRSMEKMRIYLLINPMIIFSRKTKNIEATAFDNF